MGIRIRVRVRGVGPRSQPWEGRVIPLDHTRFVGGRGLEPPLLAELVPKTSAATITPPAHRGFPLVRPEGIEPSTLSLRGICSTS